MGRPQVLQGVPWEHTLIKHRRPMTPGSAAALGAQLRLLLRDDSRTATDTRHLHMCVYFLCWAEPGLCSEYIV